MKAKFLLAAVAMAALAACGGGGGGGGGFPTLPIVPPPPPPPPPPAPPVPGPDSYAACVNEADYREGTTMVADRDTNFGDQILKTRETVVAGPHEAFAEANPVRITKTLAEQDGSGTPVSNRIYKDLVNGKEVNYGQRNGDVGADPKYGQITLDPPDALPIDMSPGQVVEGRYVSKGVSGVNGELRMDIDVSYKRTYVGRESLATPMGTFQVCKVTHVETQRVLPDGQPNTISIEDWVAADGPYRGQRLKFQARDADGALMGGSYVVTGMTYTPR